MIIQKRRERSLDQANLTVLQEFSSFGKRPLAKELVGNVHLNWFQLLDNEYTYMFMFNGSSLDASAAFARKTV